MLLNLLFSSFIVIKHNVFIKTEMLNDIKGRGQGGVNKEKKRGQCREGERESDWRRHLQQESIENVRRGDGKEGKRRENLKSPENSPRVGYLRFAMICKARDPELLRKKKNPVDRASFRKTN